MPFQGVVSRSNYCATGRCPVLMPQGFQPCNEQRSALCPIGAKLCRQVRKRLCNGHTHPASAAGAASLLIENGEWRI